MNLKLLFSISLSASTFIGFLPDIAEAGYRRCQNYPDGTSACRNESGFEFNCTGDTASTYSICTGKNNYRKECTHGKEISRCKDSNGVKYVCKHTPYANTICENSNGFRSVCNTYPDGNYSICTDVSRWGKPIKN
jgi:hypothetical protein